MDEKLKQNEEIIKDCITELNKLPKDELIKILYMVKGIAIVSENKSA